MNDGQKDGSVDIKVLSALARLDVSDDDMKKLEKQIPAILSFAARIQEVVAKVDTDKNPTHKNVMREDASPHESGIYTEALLSAAPERERNYVSVTQVLKGGKHA